MATAFLPIEIPLSPNVLILGLTAVQLIRGLVGASLVGACSGSQQRASCSRGRNPRCWQLGNAKQIREHVWEHAPHALSLARVWCGGLFVLAEKVLLWIILFFFFYQAGGESVRPSVCSCLSPSPTAFQGSCGCVGTNVFRIMLGASCMYLPTNSPMNYWHEGCSLVYTFPRLYSLILDIYSA